MIKRYKFEKSNEWHLVSIVQICLIIIITLLCGKIVINNALIDSVSAEERLSGRFLVRMENSSNFFYIDPQLKEVISLEGADYAYSFFKKHAKKLLPNELKKIPIGFVGGVAIDSDNDGLSDSIEKEIGTNVYKFDTDYDGISDKEEVINHSDPKAAGKIRADETLVGSAIGNFLVKEGSDEAMWYLNPSDGRRYFVNNPSHINDIVNDLGVLITEKEFKEIID